MVDRVTRDQAAEWIRRFVSGRIDNDEFAEEFPQSRKDPALAALVGRCWALYSDNENHYLAGDRALSREGRQEVWRWVLFLQSGLEYEWPDFNWCRIEWRVPLLLDWLTMGALSRRKEREEAEIAELESAGDFKLWPFIRQSDFDQALRQPRLLGGFPRVASARTAG